MLGKSAVSMAEPHTHCLLVSKHANHNCLWMLKTYHVWGYYKKVVSSERN